MKDYIEIGESPYDEDCAQVGSPDYGPRARRECRAYIAQLKRVYGEPPEGARLRMKTNYGYETSYEVVCEFDDNFPASVDYAFRLESDGLDKWDAEALEFLSSHSVVEN